jgi:Uma2 family endonuclease
MQGTGSTAYVTLEQYLRREQEGSTRHEYINGLLFAMSGGNLNHSSIAGNIHSLLRNGLRGSTCRAFTSDVMVRVEATNSVYYPDVKVGCGQYKGDQILLNDPVLLVEVLSRSTASIDRREKYCAYTQIPSLKEYLIVHQRRRRLELYRRGENQEWDLIVVNTASEITLESMPGGAMTLLLDEIYEDVDFPSSSDLEVREDEEDYLY